MGTSSNIPASGLQTSAQNTAQPSTPGMYGSVGEPAAPPNYSIQNQPMGGVYGQPQYLPSRAQPQYAPQAAQQTDPNMMAMSPAYNQIPSPYAAARTPPPSNPAPYGSAPYGAPYAIPLLIRPGDIVRVDTTLFWDAMNMISSLSGPASMAAGAVH